MKIFITGATGYIGQKLALTLAEQGHIIHAIVRDEQKAKPLLTHAGIVLFRGDILDQESILIAMKGCDQVYHLAALASVWHREPTSFHKINVTGLENVLNACLVTGIKDFLFTSTAGVVGHSEDGKPVCELTNLNPKLETHYEQSKVKAEKLLKTYLPRGIRGIIVNPSRVYGPGLLTESNGFTRLMKMYVNGNWSIKPGDGNHIGNYVYIDDTIEGLIAAMEKAKPGERYLLGGNNVSYNEFFNMINEVTGLKRKMYNVPLPLMLFLSYGQLMMANLFGKQPMITPSFVRKYHKNWIVSSEKAKDDIGYTHIPLKEGIKKTLDWFIQLC